MKNYSKEELYILNEKRNYLLSLRKDKLNKKIIEKRTKYINNNNKQIINIFDSNDSFNKKVKSKFYEFLSNKINKEEKYINTLNELFDIIKKYIQTNNINSISEPIIESIILEKIYNDLTLNKFINNNEILNLLLIIFSCIIFIYNHFQNTEEFKKIFISNDKYIHLYMSLLDIKDEEVIYNLYKFIGLLCKKSYDITEKLYNEKVLEKIVDNNIYDEDTEIIKIKIWCISEFCLGKKYDENINISLKIQKLYFFVFDNYLNITNNIDNELLDNWLILIKNLSFCINKKFMHNLINSKLFQFILKSNLPKDNILTIIGNMSYISNNNILLEIYRLTIDYLINIILDNKNKNEIISLCLWCINNCMGNVNVSINAFFEKNLLDIYKNIIIKSEKFDENIFYEICIGYKYLINYLDLNKAYIIIKEYNIMSLIIKGFKKLEKIELIEKIGEIIVQIIFLLFINFNEELVNFNKYTFEILGGKEYVFDKINILFLENKEYNKDNEDKSNIEYIVLEFINYIQKYLLNYENYENKD